MYISEWPVTARQRLSFSRLGRRQLGCFTEDKLLSAIFMVHEESNLQSSPPFPFPPPGSRDSDRDDGGDDAEWSLLRPKVQFGNLGGEVGTGAGEGEAGAFLLQRGRRAPLGGFQRRIGRPQDACSSS